MTVRGKFDHDGVEIVIGFRVQGQMSLYWDQDPVYQFDADKNLRRAFINGDRYKAVDGRLIRLASPAEDNAAVRRLALVGSEISGDQQRRILQRLADRLQQIAEVLADSKSATGRHQLRCIGVQPDAFCDRVSQWIDQVQCRPSIATAASA